MTGDEPVAGVVEHCYRHPGVETGVHCVRCDRPICPSCMIPASVGFHCPECVSEGRRAMRQTRTVYGGRVRPGAPAGLVTRVLIGINVAMFIVTSASGVNPLSGSGTSKVFDHLALIPPAVAHGEWWRLFTAAFLHFGIFHIGFNMYALWILGQALEPAFGRARFLAVYIISALAGSVGVLLMTPVDTTVVGASGAIFGLFGALFVVQRKRGGDLRSIIVLLVINAALGFIIPGIAWQAHLGGLIAGALCAAVIAYAPRRNRALVQWGGMAAVVLLMVGLTLFKVSTFPAYVLY